MDIGELEKKCEILLGLSDKHPSFLENYSAYLAAVEVRIPEFGDHGSKLYSALEAKPSRNSQIDTMLIMCKDVKAVNKAELVVLDKYPLSHYVFARVVATRFLKEVDLSSFHDSANTDLFKYREVYDSALYQTFSVMKDSPDVFSFYIYFREMLLRMIGSGILRPPEIAKYLPVVSKLEDSVNATNQELSLKSAKDNSTDLMQAFGSADESRLLDSSGKLTSTAIIRFLTEGLSLLYELRTSKNPSDFECYQGFLVKLSTAETGPISAYIMDAQFGSQQIYQYTKDEISKAQRICRLILSCYTADLLLDSAVYDYNRIIWGNQPFRLEEILDVTEKNLQLLQSYAIITPETQENLLLDITAKLSERKGGVS